MPNEHGQKTVGVDLDGTLLEYRPWAGPTELGEIIPAARDVVNRLKSANCYLILHTSRITGDPDQESVNEFTQVLKDRLEHEGVAFDEIWDKPGKPICDVYWDDRAVCCDGKYDLAFEKIMQHEPWWKAMEGLLMV